MTLADAPDRVKIAMQKQRLNGYRTLLRHCICAKAERFRVNELSTNFSRFVVSF
jgi:hypothetical protein